MNLQLLSLCLFLFPSSFSLMPPGPALSPERIKYLGSASHSGGGWGQETHQPATNQQADWSISLFVLRASAEISMVSGFHGD